MHSGMQRQWAGNIKGRRKAIGLTQASLASLVGVEQATISRWERGGLTAEGQRVFAVTDDMKVRIAAALCCAVGELFPWPEGVPPREVLGV